MPLFSGWLAVICSRANGFDSRWRYHDFADFDGHFWASIGGRPDGWIPLVFRVPSTPTRRSVEITGLLSECLTHTVDNGRYPDDHERGRRNARYELRMSQHAV